MEKPFVSIIVPVYNVELYLRDCLDSIVTQTCQDFEAILIDDGSSDSSGIICDEYAEKNNRFTVCHQDNCGVSIARNKGLKLANGEFVCFVDADDILMPDYVEVLYENGKNSDLTFFSVITFNKQTDVASLLISDFNSNSKECYEKYILNDIKPTIFGYTWSKMFRLSIIKENCISFVPKLSYREDYLFTSQYLRYVSSVAGISKALYKYRTDTMSSLSKDKKSQKSVMLYNFVSKAMDDVDSYNLKELRSYEYKKLSKILHHALFCKGNTCDFYLILKKLHEIYLADSEATAEALPQKLNILISLPTIINFPFSLFYVIICRLKLKYTKL